MATHSEAFHQYFKVNPDRSLELMLKAGIYRTFQVLMKQASTPQDQYQVKYSIVKALRVLTNAKVAQKAKLRVRKAPRKRVEPGFFSNQHGGRVKFYHFRATDEFVAELLKDNEDPESRPARKEQANEAFKRQLSQYLEVSTTDNVQETILNGVMLVLSCAQDFAGPMIETFREHQKLFRKLKQVYETEEIKDLLERKGCYGRWWAVDQALIAYDLEKEDEVIGRMG